MSKLKLLPIAQTSWQEFGVATLVFLGGIVAIFRFREESVARRVTILEGQVDALLKIVGAKNEQIGALRTELAQKDTVIAQRDSAIVILKCQVNDERETQGKPPRYMNPLIDPVDVSFSVPPAPLKV